jgi:hypothetical protein
MAAPAKAGPGRPKGSKNKRNQEVLRNAQESGVLPLEYMLGVMRSPETDAVRRDEMAKAAAPYLHPRLASVSHTGAGGGPIQTEELSAIPPQVRAQRMARLLGEAQPEPKGEADSESDGAVPDAGAEGAG